MWNGKQLLPEGWVEEASKAQVPCQPAGMRPEQVAERGLTLENSDWIQGYGYQMWVNTVGGGARFDPAMLYYFPQIWTSDDTDAFERCKNKIYDSQSEFCLANTTFKIFNSK